MHTTIKPVPLRSVDGSQSFLVYPGAGGTVVLERIRRNGKRDKNSIFQFDAAVAAAALASVSPLVAPVVSLVDQLVA